MLAALYLLAWLGAYSLAYKAFFRIKNPLTLIPLSFSTLLAINAFLYAVLTKLTGATVDGFFIAANACFALGLALLYLLSRGNTDLGAGETKIGNGELFIFALLLAVLAVTITSNSTHLITFADEWSYLSVMNRMASWNILSPDTIFTKNAEWESGGAAITKYLDHAWFAQIAGITRFFGVWFVPVFFSFKLIMSPILFLSIANFYLHLVGYKKEYSLVVIIGLTMLFFLVSGGGDAGYRIAGAIFLYTSLFFTLRYLRTGTFEFLALMFFFLIATALTHLIYLAHFAVFALYLITADVLCQREGLTLGGLLATVKTAAAGIRKISIGGIGPYLLKLVARYRLHANILLAIFVSILFGKVYHVELGEITGRWIAPYGHYMNMLIIPGFWPSMGYPYLISILFLAYLVKKKGWSYTNVFLGVSYLLFPVLILPPVVAASQWFIDAVVTYRVALASSLFYFTIAEFMREYIGVLRRKEIWKAALLGILVAGLFFSMSGKIKGEVNSLKAPEGPIYADSQYYAWGDFYGFIKKNYANKTILSDEQTSTPIPAFTDNYVLIHRLWATNTRIYYEDVWETYNSRGPTRLDELIGKYGIDVIAINNGSMPGLEDYNIYKKTNSSLYGIIERQPDKFRNVYRNGNITAYEVVSRMPASG